MPISLTSRFDDTELEALHAHLRQRFGVAPAQATAGP
jgi:hypothetical protein